VLERKILIVEVVSIDTKTACSVAADKVTTLAHEILNHTVKETPLVANGAVV